MKTQKIDINGTKLKIGDKVVIEAEVVGFQLIPEYSNYHLEVEVQIGEHTYLLEYGSLTALERRGWTEMLALAMPRLR